MKKPILALALTLPLLLPVIAEARPVRITTTLNAYGGDGAYLAIYVTDKAGKLRQTIHVAGGKAKYHKHLSGWFRQSGGRIDGTTGASVGAGRSLTVSAEIADALIDAGFEIRVDSAVEKESDVPADARITLEKASIGKPSAGRGYVKSIAIEM
ncbi:MAG: DUF2271 domain-containing protein [Beijerinckiaceae bacterium]|nr:DUF2271 domain-containing protein [Beijerinckiaceae bacterium]MCZ8300429.1 DUF2271 domain-containing protein [Beijerinckiaceae bacterium]